MRVLSLSRLLLLRTAACPAFFLEVGFLALELNVVVVLEELTPVARLLFSARLAATTLCTTAFPLASALAALAALAALTTLATTATGTTSMTLFVGIVATNGSALVLCAVESFHHTLSILLGNLDVGKLREQVDVSHLLATLHMFVEILHDLARIEAVGLAQVDEETLVSSLCLVLAATVRHLSTTL